MPNIRNRRTPTICIRPAATTTALDCDHARWHGKDTLNILVHDRLGKSLNGKPFLFRARGKVSVDRLTNVAPLDIRDGYGAIVLEPSPTYTWSFGTTFAAYETVQMKNPADTRANLIHCMENVPGRRFLSLTHLPFVSSLSLTCRA